MNYPVDMPTVEVTVGPLRHLETSKDLQFRVTFEAIHPSGREFPGLIWVASSERFMAITQKDRSSGESMSLVLPATNAEGWKNFEGAPIDTDGGTLHTHAYQVRLAVYRSGVYISSFTIDKVFLPEGVSPVDLNVLISVPQEPGTPIDFPDVWGALVRQAEAAALAAQQAAEDAESAAELVRDNSIVDASLSGQDLIFEKYDLSTINVGRVAGLSAYEVAVAGGFVGTEADWLASLGSTVPGPPNSLTIGTVTEGAMPAASITGASPNQTLDLTLKTGAPGPPNTLAIGTVVEGPTADATITGASPSQTLNLVLPEADAGPPNTLTAGTVTQIPAGGQPTVSITGTAPNQTLNLGLVDGSPTAFELRGEGFPGTGTNATATNAAAVGTYYTDTLGTIGAFRWIKTSAGAGTARWRVQYGDTGIRDVRGLLINGWQGSVFRVMRRHDMLWLQFDWIRFGSTNQIAMLPSGYLPLVDSNLYVRNGSSFSNITVKTTGVVEKSSLEGTPAGGSAPWLICPAETVWPTTLIGTP